jgi:hypothetical protein
MMIFSSGDLNGLGLIFPIKPSQGHDQVTQGPQGDSGYFVP